MPTSEMCVMHPGLTENINKLLQTAVENKTHIESIFNILEKVDNSWCKHINEADSPGGIRDRVKTLEAEITALKKSIWKIGIVCGFIGALLGNLTPEAVNLFVKLIGLYVGK